MKRALLLCLLMSGVPLPATADELSPVDIQLLLDKLEELRNGEKGRRDSRYSVARSAFAAAVGSDAAAHALYLKCIEKVRFDDEKSGQAWRDWKRRHKEREDTPALRRALRHQLSWLLLTLEVAEEPEEMMEFAPKAMTRVDAIFADAAGITTSMIDLKQSAIFDRLEIGDAELEVGSPGHQAEPFGTGRRDVSLPIPPQAGLDR